MTTNLNTLSADLSAHFTLVRVSISCWGNSRNQKALAQEIESQKGAQVGKSLKASKILLNEDALTPIKQIRNKITNAWKDPLTSVWGEESWRLLPNSKWTEYGSVMQPLFVEFDRVANELCSDASFNELLYEARNRLVTLFDRSDYPEDAAAFRAKFAVLDQSRSIETADDARRIKSLPAHVVEDIERKMQGQMEANIARVQAEAFNSLHTVTLALRDSLRSWKDGDQKSFKSTLWDTIEKSCTFCQQFNLTGDAHLSALVEEIRNSLLQVDPEQVRKNPAAAVDVIVAADALADKAARRRAAMANMAGYASMTVN